MRLLAIKIGNEVINPPGGIPDGGLVSFEKIIRIGIQALFTVAVILSLIFIIWGGISWITSGGEKEGLEKARKKIIYAIIGLVVTLSAFFIVNIVTKLFNISLLNFSF